MAKKNSRIRAIFRTPALKLRPGETLGITGSCGELGNWVAAVPMKECVPIFAYADVDVPAEFEYKFVVTDSETGEILLWEDGGNRRAELSGKPVETVTVMSLRFALPSWKGAGTAIPMFSLRSEDSFGVGEFLDLKKLIDWAVLTGQKIIQLLPVNDTTMTGTKRDSYPYNAVSAFALHPQYLHLPAVGVKKDKEYLRLKKSLNALDYVDYESVNRMKTLFVRKAFDLVGAKTVASKDYKQFVERNAYWLHPYAAFRVLTDINGNPDFRKWGKYAEYTPSIVVQLRRKYTKHFDFHCFEQYHLHKQFAEVKEYAHEKGIMLKGDLPIGISPTSCDAWLNPSLFNLDSSAGAPPDAFSVKGQNWGFPTYNWEKMAEDDYAWWKARLRKMEECFDAFRIDHILGFFRIWEIPRDALTGLSGHFNPALPYTAAELAKAGFDVSKGRFITPPEFTEDMRSFFAKEEFDEIKREPKRQLSEDVLFVEDPKRRKMYHPRISAQFTYTYHCLEQSQKDAFNALYEDFFYHRHNEFWKKNAMKKLPDLLSATGMLACGEDLGMIPACVPEVMGDLEILSLEIETMPKNPQETFANVAAYPYLSVCTTSTHDMSPLRAWWEEDRELSARYCREVLGRADAPYFCEPWICKQVLHNHLASPSMLAIFPLADWLSIDGDIRRENPHDERINVPANPHHYWRYRMHITLEDLLAATSLNSTIRSMLTFTSR